MYYFKMKDGMTGKTTVHIYDTKKQANGDRKLQKKYQTEGMEITPIYYSMYLKFEVEV